MGSLLDRFSDQSTWDTFATGGFSGLFGGIDDYQKAHGIGGRFDSPSDVTGTIDYGKIAELFSSAVGDLQGSALKAEQEATKAYNELQYKMFKEANAFNSAEAQKSFEREMSSAEKQRADAHNNLTRQ